MAKAMWLWILTGLLISCNGSVNQEDVRHLNGYWQIEKVVLADGSDKDYSANTTYDFFQVDKGKGFRAKVMPQFNGKFQTNDIREHFSVTTEDGNTVLSYKTDFAQWKERLVELDSLHLVVRSESDLEYHYKRAQPINLLGDGQKTE